MTLATTPFLIYHFNRFSLYGWLGNMLTGTLLSFWIMPMLFIGLALMPLGAEALFWKAAGIGLSYIVAIAERINTLPHALIHFPSFSPLILGIIAIGLALLCLMTTRLRIVGVIIFLCGTLGVLGAPQPDLLVGDHGQTIAVRANNKLRFLRIAPNPRTARIWLTMHGEGSHTPLPSPVASSSIRIKGKTIAFTADTCFGADLCFLHTDTPDPRIYPLNVDNTRAVFIRGDKITVQTP